MLGLVFSLVLIGQPVKAQNEPVLSGSTLKSEDLASKCDAIFIGQIAKLGYPVLASAGAVSYHGVEVKVLQVLRGSIDGEVVKVTLLAMSGQNVHEAPPEVGNTYIFFVHKNTEKGWNPYTAIKLLPATNDHVTKIKALIAAAPASK